MARESLITVLRSTVNDAPAAGGITFGELAYSDLNGKLFVGRDNGTALWIGAGVTDTSIATNSQYLVPTQSAVKTYVDGVVGGGSVVNSINATGGTITITGDGGAIRNLSVNQVDNKFTARIADTSVTGVASFNSSYFTVSSGAVSLASGYQVTGHTVQGDSGSAVVIVGSGNTRTVTNRLATTGVTGVASFDSGDFDVSAAGAVTIKTAGVGNTQLENSSITVKDAAGDAGQAISLGGSVVVQGTTNQISVSRSTSTLTVSLPNDVTISGNLTVNGTVVTANVDTFVVEDPLFMLATGNAADSVDIGFYGQYANPAGSKYFSGLFRDASDTGKWKLFHSLTGTAEPTTTVNTSGSGYTVGTLIAKIDGGSF
jgi:hypothetical protein